MKVAIDDKEFELSTLADVAQAIETLRIAMLFDYTEYGGLSRYAEQNFLAALSHLDLAQRHCRIGWMENMEKR